MMIDYMAKRRIYGIATDGRSGSWVGGAAPSGVTGLRERSLGAVADTGGKAGTVPGPGAGGGRGRPASGYIIERNR